MFGAIKLYIQTRALALNSDIKVTESLNVLTPLPDCHVNYSRKLTPTPAGRSVQLHRGTSRVLTACRPSLIHREPTTGQRTQQSEKSFSFLLKTVLLVT